MELVIPPDAWARCRMTPEQLEQALLTLHPGYYPVHPEMLWRWRLLDRRERMLREEFGI